MPLNKITPKELDGLSDQLEEYLKTASKDFVTAMLELAKNRTEDYARYYGLLASNDVEGALLALDYAAVLIHQGNDKLARARALGEAIFDGLVRYAIITAIGAI